MEDVQKIKDQAYSKDRETFLQDIQGDRSLKYFMDHFPKYANKVEMSRFLARHELYKLILNTRGSIVECGVAEGEGLLTWAQLSTIHEPMGVWRHIYGFDSFEGFPHVHENDVKSLEESPWKPGDLKHNTYDELLKCIEMLDRSPYPPHFPKVELIKGDFLETGEQFLKDNPQFLISLLFLDFDLYEPTKKAIELFLPRMPKGSVIAFDELNHHRWPGETMAFLETMSIRNVHLKTLPYTQRISYAVL
jgi:hypothetical protein